MQNGYSPGHPWYYKLGGKILTIDEIEPMDVDPEMFAYCRKRYKSASEMLAAHEASFAREAVLYNDLVARGIEAVSKFDRECAYGGDDQMAYCGSLSLVHNHLCYDKGYIKYIRENCQLADQTALIAVEPKKPVSRPRTAAPATPSPPPAMAAAIPPIGGEQLQLF